MPVFTFMGLNVFHRDDEYSLRVIQKVGIDYLVCSRNLIVYADYRYDRAHSGVFPQKHTR